MEVASVYSGRLQISALQHFPSGSRQCYFKMKGYYMFVLRPGKGECADPVNEDAILEKDGGGAPQPE